MKEISWMSWMQSLLTLGLLGLSWYILLSNEGTFNAVRYASPAIEAYTVYLMGVSLLAATVGIWALFGVIEIEHRLKLLEDEWEEVNIGGEEDEVGYA